MIASEPSLLGDELRSHVPGKKPGKGRHRGKPRRAYEYDPTPHSVLAAADPGPGRHSHSRRRPSTRAFHSDAHPQEANRCPEPSGGPSGQHYQQLIGCVLECHTREQEKEYRRNHEAKDSQSGRAVCLDKVLVFAARSTCVITKLPNHKPAN